MEPQEGHFNFDWLDRSLKALNAHGIKAMLGTPTASPPAWLYAKYPDVAVMDPYGVRYRFGSRHNTCLHSPAFIAATRRIVTAMAEHYKDHPGVIGWQIDDDEVGDPPSFDPYSRAAFQNWCQNKYQTLDALNQAWGTVFWGETYEAWSEIPLPWNLVGNAPNPSLALDWDRFMNYSVHNYLDIQTSILREMAPRQAITHEVMGMYPNVDYYDLSRLFDFVSWENYPSMAEKDYAHYTQIGLAADLTRGAKDNLNFVVMEQQIGIPGWYEYFGRQAPPELYRVWVYQSVAHGADGICYFRWRSSRYGTEQYWQGVLDPDSYPNSRYQVVVRTGKELVQLTKLLHGSNVVSAVAMLVSPDSRWAFEIQPLVKDFQYNRQILDFYDAFRRAGVGVDAVFPQTDISSYRVVVAPALFVADQSLANKLTGFVTNGGTLILTFRTGVKDEHNVVTTRTLPGVFAELAGVAIHDFDPQLNEEQEVVGPDEQHFPTRVWSDILEPTTAKVVAYYGKGYYAGKAAVTENRVGKGSVYYVGTESVSPIFYDRLVASAAQKNALALNTKLPQGVELAVRQKADTKILFLLNYTSSAQTVPLGQAYRNALTGKAEPMDVQVPPYDVKVLTDQ
jgi:beta-galactosidase